ncbi:MAG: glycosyl hydrolase [Ignavibacteriae bacterium]|nr:glycosyl hydrolase [Ignavibacteriota bacterium]MCB9260203.1 glycosyl hydrolase [Ignavibacteriales bacterium]
MKTKTLLTVLILLFTISIIGKDKLAKEDSLKNISLSGLSFRSIGPAITGGRIIDIAVNPNDHSNYYIASGNGGLWKTTNSGITFTPVFDNQNSYSIGAVEIDPTNPNIVWVGTGENSNHNNVTYGDGIYKSEDGGKSWENLGLKESQHIGGITIDPNNSNIVYAAAMGGLRTSGGDRGIFKSEDGGKSWNNVLKISEFTGCFEIHMDPRFSNILYAVAHQRMRNLYSGVSGGPESAIYRTIDSGKSWIKITKGLPSEDIGRTGMAISPVNPDALYAIVEAKKEKGIYKSTDRGASWTKQNEYMSSYPFYFQKIYGDTKDENTVYSMDVFTQVSRDGGKSWSRLGSDKRHVDDHALWVNPINNNHMLIGCDGGVYETYDQGKNWDFKSNLPIAEIYKVTTDNAKPFYNVYAGTQDNNSFTGPSRTISSGGITNHDWIFTQSGDGFETQVDWKDPNIVYAQYQYAGLVKFNKKTGEKLYIRPVEFSDTAYRFDWDAPLLISQHNNKRLYLGAQMVLRTNDQGNSWEEISEDLTRGVPQEIQKLMGRTWSIDELAHKSSMAQLSTIAESPLDENILFVGSSDGLIHFSNDGGKSWQKSSQLPGLPEYSRIHHIIASQFDKNIAYAACHRLQAGDYKPYIYKTVDGGKTWNSINSNLPERGSTYTIQEDHVDKNLLFTGTQFGVYFSNDGGKEWIKLANGIPNISVMDIHIQKEENDLVVSTFGRGIYILDDYSPLRFLSSDNIKKDSYLFPISSSKMFIESDPFSFRGVGFMGASFYSAPNPEVGAVFTYYLKNDIKSFKDKRRELEKEQVKNKEDIKYPNYEQLKKEQEQPESYLLFTISDESGNVVRKIKTEPKKGVNRITWNFRYNPFTPVSLKPFDDSVPWNEPDRGYMVVPGKYFVSLSKFEDGIFTQISEPIEFLCEPLHENEISESDKNELNKFNSKVAELTRALSGADSYRQELADKISYLKKAVLESVEIPTEMFNDILNTEKYLNSLNNKFHGDRLRTHYEGGIPASIKDKVDLITSSLWVTTSLPTETFIKSFESAANEFSSLIDDLKIADDQIKLIENKLEKLGAPYTPGRFPIWNNK